MKRQEHTLRAGTFVFYMTMAAVLPYFPIYFQSLGFSNLQLGLLYSAGPMTGIFAALLWGVWSDKYQTIKKLFIVVFLGQLIMLAVIGQTRIFALLLPVMLIFYFFQSAVIPLNDSMILLHIRKRGGIYASFRVWASFGFASTVLPFGMIVERGGPQTALWLCAGTVALSLLLSFLLEERSASRTPFKAADLLKMTSNRQLLIFFVSVYALAVGHRMNDAFVPLVVKDVGGTEDMVGLAQLMSGLSEIPVFLLLVKYGRSFHELTLLVTASLVYIVRFLLMSITTNIVWMIALQCLHGLSFCIYLYAAVSMLQKLVPERFRATGQALFAFVWSGLAGLTAGTVGGFILDSAGAGRLYETAAAFAFLGMTGFAVMMWSVRSGKWLFKEIGTETTRG